MIGFIMMLLFKKTPLKKGFWACRRKEQAPSGCRYNLCKTQAKDFRLHPSRGFAVKFGFNQPFKFDEENRTFYSIAYVSNSAADFGNSEQGKAR